MELSSDDYHRILKAIRKQDEETIGRVLEGTDLAGEKRNLLHPALVSGNESIVRLLARKKATLIVKDGCDPLVRALETQSRPLLAALLDTTTDTLALGNAVACAMTQGHDRMRLYYLLRKDWEDLAVEVLRHQSKGDLTQWWEAAISSDCSGELLQALQARAPWEEMEEKDKKTLLATFAQAMPEGAVLSYFKEAGLLDGQALFNQTEEGVIGLLGYAFATRGIERRKTSAFLSQLLDHAYTLPQGPEYIRHSADVFIFEALGLNASLPLARKVAKKARVDLDERVSLLTDEQGRTLLHVVLSGTSHLAQRAKLLPYLLDAGLDPMQKDLQGRPACYDLLVMGKAATEELVKKFIAKGADFSPEGAVGRFLDIKCKVAVQRERLMVQLRQWHALGQAHHLDAQTPSAASRGRPRF